MKIPKIVHESWHEHLQPLFDSSKMLMTAEQVFIDKYYPEKDKVFRVFQMPFDKVRVVLLGQDPYPKKGQAIGLSFAVGEDTMEPASLRRIRSEIAREIGEDGKGLLIHSQYWNTDRWKTLDHWFHQGVLLLNSALTVRAGEAGSHIGYWQWFARDLIRIISIYNNPVWIMWGSKAKAHIGYIHNYYKWHKEWKGDKYSYILEADHPASESYPGNRGGFTGCDHFRICNDILTQKKQPPIYW